MIDLYTFNSPAGHKATIALEELGLDYQLQWVDITEGEHHQEWYRRISPNEKIPAIVDHNGPDGHPLAVMESGAILLYLAEKTGKLLSAAPRERCQTIQWLFFHQPDEYDAHPRALNRHEEDARRLLGALDEQLGKSGAWLVGDYSIADIATAPWIDTLETLYGAEELLCLDEYEHVGAWRERFEKRPAVIKGRSVLPKRLSESSPPQKRSRKSSATRRRSDRPGVAVNRAKGTNT